jgi:2-dehydro-3-deoxygalactonokinase
MEKFLSCDWGTTSFRLRLIQTSDYTVIMEEASEEGISRSFNLWKQSRQIEEERMFFYLRIIKDHIHRIETKLKYSLKGIPVIVSGMATSTLGMMELPYKMFQSGWIWNRNQEDGTLWFFNHDLLLISVKTADDVMREETKMVGCEPVSKTGEELFIFQGPIQNA